MKLNRWHSIALITLVAGVAWLWLSRTPVDGVALGTDPAPTVDHPAPDLVLPTLDGAEFSLSELRGTPVVLNFWATWCGPCQRELPELQEASERYAGRVLIVGVDQGEEAEIVQGYVDELGLTFTVPMDTDFDAADLYNVRGLPTTFFIDRNGVIRDVWAGEMNSITLAEKIRRIYP